MTLVAAVVSASVALLFLLAGAAKLAAPRAFIMSLQQLGGPVLSQAWVLVPLLEIGCAFMLVFAPGALPTTFLLVGLGTIFAAAGAYAARRRLAVRCACFGQTSRGTLGMRQVATLPLWIAVAVFLRLAPHSEMTARPMIGAMAISAAIVIALARVFPHATNARNYLRVVMKS